MLGNWLMTWGMSGSEWNLTEFGKNTVDFLLPPLALQSSGLISSVSSEFSYRT
uniref:Uncharacterized protein n=1 Tax=Arundo donax TaxID=35708 RepID=A0A0A9E6Q9_ARUDO